MEYKVEYKIKMGQVIYILIYPIEILCCLSSAHLICRDSFKCCRATNNCFILILKRKLYYIDFIN